MRARHTEKIGRTDLGLANLESQVVFETIRRNDFGDTALKNTTKNRASIKDLAATRPTDYVSNYLTKIT